MALVLTRNQKRLLVVNADRQDTATRMHVTRVELITISIVTMRHRLF